MLLLLATLALALAHTASAHGTMYGISVNGKPQGDGRDKYIRKPPSNNPVLWSEVKSPALICNRNGGTAAPEFVKVNAGDKLSFQWFHSSPNDPNDDPYIFDKSHKGAILTYIAPYPQGDGTGPIWSKIHHAGFDGGEWATMKMVANKGFVEFSLPKALKGGKYLVRQELLALHMADYLEADGSRGPEFYPSCVQIEVADGGSATPSQNYDINKGYSAASEKNGQGLFFNVHIPATKPYQPPGPEVWSGN